MSIIDEKTKIIKVKKSKLIRVFNNVAKRGVALMEEHNKLYTKNEEQKSFFCY